MGLAAQLLGSVEVPGARIRGGVKPRAMLVTLLLQANQTVSIDRLVEALWDTEPPRSALANLRTYAYSLRQPLERVGISLDSTPGGYALHVVPDRCDHLRFGELADRGRGALAEGHVRTAIDLLQQALGLWRGMLAAEGVPRYGPLACWLGDLEEERLRSVETLAEAQIAAKDSRDAVRELNTLLAVAPLRGRAWWLRMLAHHRLGENDNVVATYREAARTFREELGVDPDPALTKLYQVLLRWGAPGGAEPSVLSGPVAPLYLPAPETEIVGRDRELAALIDASRSGNTQTIVVHGPWYAGTSAVVLEAAHRLAEDFPDGRLYLDLRRTPQPAAVVPSVLRMLGAVEVPDDAAEASALLRGLSTNRGLLLMLDNVTGPAQVAPAQAFGGIVLVAGTHPLGSVGARHRFAVARLNRRDAVEMLRRLLGRRRAGSTALHELAGLCGCLPGVLRIAATRLIDTPELPVEHLVARLRDERRALAELEVPDAGLRDRLTAVLENVSPEAREAFYLYGREYGRESSAVPEPVLERVLEELARAHLLTPGGVDGYRVPRLVRLLLVSQA